jgi:hypothetical protein
MPEIFNDAVEINGQDDVTQLIVRGDTSQGEPLQQWRTSTEDILAQVTVDGRIELGNNAGLASALIDANKTIFDDADPAKQGFQSRGVVDTGATVSTPLTWSIQELKFDGGADSISSVQTAQRVTVEHKNTGTSSSATLRAGRFQAIHDSTNTLGELTGVEIQLERPNSAGVITNAYGLRIKTPINGAGSGGNLYAIHTEKGTVHLGDQLSIVGSADTPQLVVKAHSSQSASLAEWQNSGGTVLSAVDSGGYIGIGTSTPSAALDLKASASGRASLRVRSGTAPSSPNDGDLWTDSTQKALQEFQAGITQSLSGVIFTQTATVTVSNTATETTLVGSGIGTMTLPANFFTPGKTLHIKAGGFYGTHSTAPYNYVRIKLGSTTILVTAADVLASGIGNDREWILDALITCRAIGSSGTVIGQGMLMYSIGGASTKNYPMQNLATTTVNTTNSLVLSLTTNFNTIHASNIMNCTNLSVVVLN